MVVRIDAEATALKRPLAERRRHGRRREESYFDKAHSSYLYIDHGHQFSTVGAANSNSTMPSICRIMCLPLLGLLAL
jgi:hypothetical protein